jgi:hypothetical protein
VKPLVYRHNRVARLTTGSMRIALTILFVSGLQIFNRFPHLNWGSKAEPEEGFFHFVEPSKWRCLLLCRAIRLPNPHDHVLGVKLANLALEPAVFRAGSRFRATSGWPVDAVGTSSLVSCSPSMGFFILSTIL